MKAIVLTKEHSKPEYVKADDPQQEADEVVLELSASALNHRDVWITEGAYPGIKIPCIMGSDGMGMYSGKRYLINPGLNWGDNEAYQSDDFEVLGMPKNGTFAEAISIASKYIYDVPDHLSDHEAAALPLAGLTAYRTLFTRCDVQQGDTVLVSGIGGGVAQMAMQFAVAIGCDVFVTSGDVSKIKQAIKIGASGGVNYNDEDWYKQLKRLSGGFDVIIDSAGGDGFQHFIKLCNPGAKIGFYGASLGRYNNLNPQLLFWRQISILGSTMGSDIDFQNMLNFVSHNKITPIIDKVYPLNQAVSGFERMESGKQFGKIVFDHTA